jgi:hypothetical protein
MGGAVPFVEAVSSLFMLGKEKECEDFIVVSMTRTALRLALE